MSTVGALFYPYHPSDGVWLRHALLYYDFIATTVPTELEKQIDACALPEHLQVLRDAGVYVSSTDSVGMRPVATWLSKLDRAFDFAAVPGAEDVAISTFLNPAFIAKETKTGEEVKLADFLAEAVTTLSNDALVPSTDSEASFHHLYGHDPSSAARASQSAYITYHELLPAPRADTPIRDLLAFRSKYKDERVRLQSALAQSRKRIGENMDPSALKFSLTEIAKEINSACADLRAALGSNSIDTSVGILRELVSIKPPYPTALVGAAAAISASAVSTTTFDPSKLTIEQALVGLGVAGAVSVASALVSLVTSRQAKLRQSPYAYLYRAARSGIIEA